MHSTTVGDISLPLLIQQPITANKINSRMGIVTNRVRMQPTDCKVEPAFSTFSAAVNWATAACCTSLPFKGSLPFNNV